MSTNCGRIIKNFFKNSNQTAFIIGDINADLLRNKKFDIIFENKQTYTYLDFGENILVFHRQKLKFTQI